MIFHNDTDDAVHTWLNSTTHTYTYIYMYTTKSNHQTKTKPGHTGATIKVIMINIGIILSDYVYGDKVVTYLMISLKRKMLYIYIQLRKWWTIFRFTIFIRNLPSTKKLQPPASNAGHLYRLLVASSCSQFQESIAVSLGVTRMVLARKVFLRTNMWVCFIHLRMA